MAERCVNLSSRDSPVPLLQSSLAWLSALIPSLIALLCESDFKLSPFPAPDLIDGSYTRTHTSISQMKLLKTAEDLSRNTMTPCLPARGLSRGETGLWRGRAPPLWLLKPRKSPALLSLRDWPPSITEKLAVFPVR